MRQNPEGGISWGWIVAGAAVAWLLFRPGTAHAPPLILPPTTGIVPPPAPAAPSPFPPSPAPASATQAGVAYQGMQTPATVQHLRDLLAGGADANLTPGPSAIYSSATGADPILSFAGYSIGEPSLLGPWMYLTAVPNWVALAPDPSAYPAERVIWLAAMFDGVPWIPAQRGHWTMVGPIVPGWAPDIGADYVLHYQNVHGPQSIAVDHATGQPVAA